LRDKGDIGDIGAMTTMSSKVSARLDPDVLEVVERTAAAERRPVSAVVRNVLQDWAGGRLKPVAAEEKHA
jgi:hypothetical protein